MEVKDLLENAKGQLSTIQQQLKSNSLSVVIRNQLLQNQTALQQAYNSLLASTGIYDAATKQALEDALTSTKRASLAAAAESNKKKIVWIVGSVIVAAVAVGIVLKLRKRK